jgi:hypothetical protein
MLILGNSAFNATEHGEPGYESAGAEVQARKTNTESFYQGAEESRSPFLSLLSRFRATHNGTRGTRLKHRYIQDAESNERGPTRLPLPYLKRKLSAQP